MTRPAAIGQDDYDRALKACKKAGYEQVRIRLDLARQTIDIFVGENHAESAPARNPWDDVFDEPAKI